MGSTKTALLSLAIVVGAGAPLEAAPEWSKSSIEPGRYRLKEIIDPLSPFSITQNLDPNTIAAGTSIACTSPEGTRDTGWWRLYDLDTDHGFGEEYCTRNVDYGIETATGPQSITANVYCLDEGLPFVLAFLTLAGTASQPQPDADIEFFNIDVFGCCNGGTQDMAVELLSEDCVESGTCSQLFVGFNDSGQTAPSYVSAPDCGVTDPFNLSVLGFPSSHLIQVVNGSPTFIDCFCCGCDTPACDSCGDICVETCCQCCGCGSSQCNASCGGLECVETCGDVPATTGPGAMLTILVLLVTSALLLRGVSMRGAPRRLPS